MAVQDKIISFWKQVRLKSSDMFTKFKVGIGVKVPTHKLHVKDKTDPLKIEGLQNDTTDPDKFLTIDSSNIVKYRTGAEVLSDIGGTPLTTEEVQDIVGGMFSGNTETNITVTYEDSDGTIDLVATDTNTTYSEATSSSEGLMSTAHHDKLDGIEAGATADQTQADINGLAITTVGTIDSGTWQGTAIASAYLDSDTAHLSVAQTFTGEKTFERKVILDGNKIVTAGGDGVTLHIDAQNITDNSTSSSGTATFFNHIVIEEPSLLAINASVTTTNASTLYIKGAPTAGTNQTITNAYSLYVAAGSSYLGGGFILDGNTITGIDDSDEFTDDDAHIMTSAAVNDRIEAVASVGWLGSSTRVKILHSDFIPDDGGRPAMMDDSSSDRWLESHGTLKLFAAVPIPTGYTATHVNIYGSATSAVTVYEADINSKTVTSKGTGNIGTEIDITDVASDTTNYLLIELAQASGEEVYGGYVTIAAS